MFIMVQHTRRSVSGRQWVNIPHLKGSIPFRSKISAVSSVSKVWTAIDFLQNLPTDAIHRPMPCRDMLSMMRPGSYLSFRFPFHPGMAMSFHRSIVDRLLE
jgi:hypothetical protein